MELSRETSACCANKKSQQTIRERFSSGVIGKNVLWSAHCVSNAAIIEAEVT
ncbi:hypothetical protein [Mesorhizobium sp.]|jgi:hypothetical protein|uniref:hypothetical protein n=1 Tax=Mesorhizobium sp. TaxID=1871066 RepID=UPI00356488C8